MVGGGECSLNHRDIHIHLGEIDHLSYFHGNVQNNIISHFAKIGKINFAPCLENVLWITRHLVRKVLFSVGILCGPKATVEQAALTLYQPALLKVICLQSTCFQSSMK